MQRVCESLAVLKRLDLFLCVVHKYKIKYGIGVDACVIGATNTIEPIRKFVANPKFLSVLDWRSNGFDHINIVHKPNATQVQYNYVSFHVAFSNLNCVEPTATTDTNRLHMRSGTYVCDNIRPLHVCVCVFVGKPLL